jgi:hypothetical protein
MEATSKTTPPRRVFVACLAVFALLLLVHNSQVFTRPIHEDSDYAANSILIARAKGLKLLVGNYSRTGFNHPGPALLYVLAGSEILFHDLLGLVPAPHNAHALGALLYNALLAALSLAVLHAHYRSRLAVLVAVAAFLAYFSVNGQIASGWMPDLYFAPFLLLLVSAASIACGRARHLPCLALAGGLLVHGHVCFVAFVGLLTAYALAGLARAQGFAWRELLRAHMGSFLAFSAVVGLFVLPIALHTLLDFPGEMGRYLEYLNLRQHRHALTKVGHFLLLAFTSESSHPLVVSLAVLTTIAVTLPRRSDDPRRHYTRQVLAACGITTTALFFYAWRGIDDLSLTYTAAFFGSVLLLLLATGAMNVALRIGADPRRRRVLAFLAAVVALGAAVGGRFTNTYTGSPYVADLAAAEAEATAPDTPIIVTHEPSRWKEVAGFVVAMQRRGRHVFVAERQLEFLYTAHHTHGWEGLTGARRLDFARRDAPTEHVRKVVYEGGVVSVREPDPRYEPGTVLSFAEGCRDWEVHKGRGWSRSAAGGTHTEGPEACLSLDLTRPIGGDALLSITAVPCLPVGQAAAWVDVVVNGQQVGRWAIEADGPPAELRAGVPAAVLDRGGPVRITLQLPWAGSAEAPPCLPYTCPRGLRVASLCLAAE